MKRPTIRLLALLLILRVGHATTPALLQAQTIWVEGQKPARATMSRHPWWYDQVKKNLLSGSDWISNWSDDKDGVAEYVIEVPVTGHYTLWIRANPVGTRLAYDGSTTSSSSSRRRCTDSTRRLPATSARS